MAGTFKFELVSPERILVSEDVEQVILSGTEGQFTVLAGHSPMISTLKPGLIEATAKGKTRRIYVRGGFAEVEPDRLTVLVERGVDAEDLKSSTLDSELKSAEAALEKAPTDEARRLAQSALDTLRAMTR
jgi:F-type H+-transporting ATPase subunit epsilon